MLSRFDRLRSWRTWWWAGRSARVAALSAALRAAPPEEVDALAGELIADLAAGRARFDTLCALAAVWSRLSADAQETVLAVGGDRLARAVEDLLRAPDELARRGGIQIAASLGVTPRAEAIVPLLNEAGPTADAAFEALRTMLGEGPVQRPVVEAICAACRSADAHQRQAAAVMIARVLWSTGDVGGGVVTVPLRAWLNDPSNAAHLVMRSALRRGRDSRLDLLAWRWLSSPALGAACAARLVDRQPPESRARVLAQWPLWLNPARARAATRAARERPVPIPPPGPGAALAERLGYLHAASRLPCGPEAREVMFGAVLSDPDPRVRLALVRLAAQAAPAPACLTDLTFDPDPRVAIIAAGAALAQRGRSGLAAPERIALARTLARSPHAAVRALAADALRVPPRGLGPAGFISVQQPDEVLVRRLGRWSRAQPGRAAMGDLAEFIRGSESTDRPRARATALVVLSRTGDSQYDGLLIGAARDGDARVRANALEAIARRARRPDASPALAGALRTGLEDQAPRAAAAAIRGVIRLQPRTAGPDPSALRRTLDLLRSVDAADRSAGLWLVARLAGRFAGVAAVLDAVAATIKAPATPQERARAQHAADRLLWHVREGWKARATGVGTSVPAAEVAA